MRFDFSGSEAACLFTSEKAEIKVEEVRFCNTAEAQRKALEWMQLRFNTAFDLDQGRLSEIFLVQMAKDEVWVFCAFTT